MASGSPVWLSGGGARRAGAWQKLHCSQPSTLCAISGNVFALIDSSPISWHEAQSLIMETTASVETNATAEKDVWSR
jgi:hypothetical protein